MPLSNDAQRALAIVLQHILSEVEDNLTATAPVEPGEGPLSRARFLIGVMELEENGLVLSLEAGDGTSVVLPNRQAFDTAFSVFSADFERTAAQKLLAVNA